MKKLIIANWKMNPKSPREALRLAGEVGRGIKGIKNVEVVLAPPFVFLPLLKLSLPRLTQVRVGAQDVFWESEGAYTGEISSSQLKASDIKYVIVGHSERRALGETNEIVNKKLKAVLGAGMRAVLCVGEAERQKEVAFPKIIREELHEGLAHINKSLSQNLVIAYEPIWAIGSGRADTPDNVYEISILIKRELYRMLGKNITLQIPILYGGSVDSKNTADFIKNGAINGFLVGGASLNAKKFVKIVKEAAKL